MDGAIKKYFSSQAPIRTSTAISRENRMELQAVRLISPKKGIKNIRKKRTQNIHPHSTDSWKSSTHYDNARGIRVHCVDCHLPPKGEGYLPQKVRTGVRDVWGKLFTDPESLNWEAKSQIEYAKGHVFQTSCTKCHANLFPLGLTKEGREAHLYFEDREDLHCIN